MRTLIIVINGLVAGSGAYAFLNAETGSFFILVAVVSIIVYGEFLRRVYT